MSTHFQFNSHSEMGKTQDRLKVTDLISSEGFNSLLNQTDTVHKLLILDRFLFKKQSKKANIWRY